MTAICPTILASTPDEFSRQLSRLERFATRVQIDIMDGDFAKPTSVSLNQIYWPEDWTVDLHLMLRKPTEWIEMIVSLNPHLAIVHAESDGDLIGTMEHLRKFGIKSGVALLPETLPEKARELIVAADHVLLFAGSLGEMGGTANLNVLEKVAKIREINPHVEIGWDGGANMENVRKLANGGIDVINVGSAVMNADDPEIAYDELRSKL